MVRKIIMYMEGNNLSSQKPFMCIQYRLLEKANNFKFRVDSTLGVMHTLYNTINRILGNANM